MPCGLRIGGDSMQSLSMTAKNLNTVVLRTTKLTSRKHAEPPIVLRTPMKRVLKVTDSIETASCDTDRLISLQQPKQKVKSDIELSLGNLRTINPSNSEALITAMSNIISLQQQYIRHLEEKTPVIDPVATIPQSFTRLQQSLDKFSQQTRYKRRILSNLEQTNNPVVTNLNAELNIAEPDQMSVQSFKTN